VNRRLSYLWTVLAVTSLACSALTGPLEGQPGTSEQPSRAQSQASPSGGPIQVSCTHHLSTKGKDTNPGTQDAPWRTLQYAADTAKPGSTVCFHAGIYEEAETVTFTRSGEAGAPITFAAAPGEAVTFQGSLYVNQGVSHVNVVGLIIRGFRYWGVALQGDNQHIVFSALNVVGGEAGFHFTEGESGQPPSNGPVTDVIVEDSIIHDATYTAVDCTPGPCNSIVFRRLEIYGSGIEAGFGGDGIGLERGQNVLVEDCYIHDNGGDGIDLNSRDFNGNVPAIVVRRNRVARNHLQGIKLWAGGRMENNVVWGQGINPVMVGKFTSTVELYNNTIAFNMVDPAFSERDYAFVAAYPEKGGPPNVSLILVNNIFAFNTGPGVGSPTGIYLGPGVTLTESHNLFWSREDGEIQADFIQGHDVWFTRAEIGDGAWARYSGQGAGDLTADPLFLAGWPKFDPHLEAGSPALGAGLYSGAPLEDLEGCARATPPSIGASEGC
jgi:hypothetical protein